MVSEIKGPRLTLVKPAAQTPNNTKSGATAGTEAPSSPATTVSFTDISARLQALAESIEKLPVVDQQRVEELRTAIADGAYELDPDGIAEKFVALERELARAQ